MASRYLLARQTARSHGAAHAASKIPDLDRSPIVAGDQQEEEFCCEVRTLNVESYQDNQLLQEG